MNNTKKETGLPALTVDLLEKGGDLVDNLFADLWNKISMKSLLKKAGFSKRSGTQIDELVYILIIWIWLKKSSIGMFCRDSLDYFATNEKDVLYDILNREDLNWLRGKCF